MTFMLPGRGRGEARSTRRPRPSIRLRLILLAVIAIAPLMVDRVRLLEADRREQLAAAYQQATILAREASQAQQDIATGAHAVLQIVARTLASVESRQACPEIFGQAPIGVSWLRGLSLLDRNGRIVCSTFVGATGLDFSDRPYFQEALRTGGFALSDYLLGRHQPGPTILAALALKDARGGVTGIVSASIDMQWIGRLAGVIDERPGAVVLVVDRAGTLISSHPAGLGEPGRRLGDPQLVEAMLGHAAGTVASAGVDGVRRIFAFQRLEATDARLAVGLNEAEVLWRIDRETTIGYVQLAIVCAAVLVGVWMGGERLIIQPIRSLTRSAIRIGLGNLQTRLSATSWAAEFAPLAAALDSMAHKLGAREDELRFANTHLAELASIDGLSGLANRRAFDAALATDWQQAIEQRHPLGLLMIDVDHFKLFNDTHGHVEGDECLRAVGEVIAQIAFERSCTPARYGGEEFALLMPAVDEATARGAAEQLRQAIADLNIVNAGTASGKLTVSIGVAVLAPPAGLSPQALVEAADSALYAAKRNGRNVVAAHPEPALVPAG